MITTLLDGVAPLVTAADAVLKTDQTVTVSIGVDHVGRLERYDGVRCHLRVLKDDRIGMAGATDYRWQRLRQAAIDSAEVGTLAPLFLPSPAATPEVHTADRVALSAGPMQLLDLARSVVRRLEEDRWRVEVWAERSAGRVEVANTRGVVAGYDQTLVGVGVTVFDSSNPTPVPLSLQTVGSSWPTGLDVEALVAAVTQWLSPPPLDRLPNPDPVRICLGPRAVRALLRPLELGLLGESVFDGSSPFRDRVGDVVVPEVLTIVDDPTISLRPASRPVDDDGVVSRRLALIDRGRFTGWVSDLASGARLGIPSTGHARRQSHAPPRVAYSNLIVGSGEVPTAEFLTEGEAILVEDLPIPTGNVIDGRVTLVTPWAYWMSEGERVGRFRSATISGNVFDLLQHIVAVGREQQWIGSWCGPSILVDGVDLRVR